MRLIKERTFNAGLCSIDSDIADIAVAGATSAASAASDAQSAADDAMEAAKAAEEAAETAGDIVETVAQQTAIEMVEALRPMVEDISTRMNELQTQIDDIKAVQMATQPIVVVEPEAEPEIVEEATDNKDDGLIVADEVSTHTPPQDRRKRYRRI